MGTETQFRYRKPKSSFDIGNPKPGFRSGNQSLFFYVSHLSWYLDLKPQSNFGIVIWANTFSVCFFQMVLRFPHFLGYGHFGFQHFAETKIMVSVVDCVAAQVMSLGFSADFMWLNKLKTSEKARVFHTLMAYLWDAKILLFLCKKSLRMPFFSSQNALFNGKTVAIRVKIYIVSSGLHS